MCPISGIWHTVCTHSWLDKLLLAGDKEVTLAHDRITIEDQPRYLFELTKLDHVFGADGEITP